MAPPDPLEVVELANTLLEKLPGSRRVMSLSDMNAAFYVLLYEGLFAEPLRDAVIPATAREDEIHNVQMVIDSLSMDKLNTSMSHISGQQVVDRDIAAVYNLIQVFEWLYEYMLERISETSSAAPSIVSDVDNVHDFEDPDLVTPELIDDVLQRELNKSRADSTLLSQPGNNSTAELIALGNGGGGSGQKRNGGDRDGSGGGADDTAELIALGDSRYGRTPPHRGPREDSAARRGAERNNQRPSTSVATSLFGQARPALRTADLSSKPPRYTDQHRLRMATEAVDSTPEESVVLPAKPVDNKSSRQFDHIGAQSRASSNHLSSSLDKDYSAKRTTTTRTAHTYHHYHHYNGAPPSARTAAGAATAASAGAVHFDGTRSLPTHLIDQMTAAQAREQRNIDTQTTPGLTAADRKESGKSSDVPPPLTSTTSAYERLQSLVADTVSMSRAAVDKSPQLGRREVQPSATMPPAKSTASSKSGRASSTSPQRSTKSSPRKESARRLSPRKPQSILSKGAGRNLHRKVSFITNRSLSDSEPSTDTSPEQRNYQRVLDRLEREKGRAGKKVAGSKGSKTTGLSGGGARKSGGGAKKQSNAPGMNGVPLTSRSATSTTTTTTSDDDDDDYFSDGCVDYGAESDDEEGEFMRELRRYKEKLDKRAKKVRFGDILDQQAPGMMGPVRRQLLNEDRELRKQTEFLRDRYDDEVVDYEEALREELQKLYDAAKTKDFEYRKKVLRQPKTNKYKPQKKYNVPYAGTGKSSVLYSGGQRAGRSQQRISRSRKRSASASPHLGGRAEAVDELLPFLLEEFPYLHLAPETVHSMWKKSAHQIQVLQQAERDMKTKKSKAMQQVEEAEAKHKILVDMMQKEVKHASKKREVEERRRQQAAVQASIRDKRISSARSRRYYDEYQCRMRAKKLKKRTKEELIFKELFNEGLEAQKERIRELRKYAKEQRDMKAKKNQDQVESIENYYKDQFQMLSEMLENEKNDRKTRDKAQTHVVQQVQRELRKRLEDQVKDLQEQILKDQEDVHFRELDAQRLRSKLKLTRFQSTV